MSSSQDSKFQRFGSIDLLRGAVMILMALDHVRVFSGTPAGEPVPGVFITRWVTHFCAPAFVFLAGTSAFLFGRKGGSLSRFLLVRGALLVLLELTVIRLAWTFNFDFAHYEMAGVIWAIGWCMIIMAGLSKLPVSVVAGVGLVIVAGHNLFDAHFWTLAESLGQDLPSAYWKIMYVGFFAGPILLGPEGPNLIVLYSIVPWIGVMACGYAFGVVLTREAQARDRFCVTLGLSSTALFVVLRSFNLYGDFSPWNSENGTAGAIMSFLNTSKYPASLQFLLMTLGPMIALVPWAERARGAVADGVRVLGRVPMWFYLLHIPLIHAFALVVSYIRMGEVSSWLFENHPMGSGDAPEGYRWSLATVYLVWIVSVFVLYFCCRWYADVKSRRNGGLLKYL